MANSLKTNKIKNLFLIIGSFILISSQALATVNLTKLIDKQKIKENQQGIHYKVFILSGQSNMVGVAPNTDFPIEYRTEQTNVQIWAAMHLDASLANKWLNVKPGFGSILPVSGCELSFAKEISKRFPNENIRLIKGAWGGSSMVEHWLSPSAGIPSKEDYYHSLLNTVVQPALSNITANGGTYEIAGFLWMQGESDAITESTANDYESNLSYFIKDIHKDLGVENLPFIIGKIDIQPSWPFNAIVRQAQDNVAAKLKNVGIFDTAGFETDNVHYHAAGYVKLGTQFATQFINVLPKVYVSQLWDDVTLNDLRLVEILKRYNAKATFAVDAGNLTEVRQPDAWVVNGTAFGKVSIDHIKNIFSEFEIANHGLSHKALTQLTPTERNKEIIDSKNLLESWLNRPIKGFVYPGCPYDELVKNAVSAAGHTWARTCENAVDFCSNTDPLEFRTTVPFNAGNFWNEFNRIKAKGGVFSFWGHTFFTSEAEWVDIESKIARLSQDPAVVWTNTSDLFEQFANKCEHTPSVTLGSGNGLNRSLWAASAGGRVWFKDSICSSVVPQIKEFWGTSSPGCEVSNDFWNARYTGEIEPLYSENYNFTVTTNQRVRLWLDNVLVIDQWGTISSQKSYSFAMNLTAGKKISMKLDYGKMQGDAYLKFEWTSPSQVKEGVSSSQLYATIPTNLKNTKLKTFSVYPNPTTNQLTLNCGNQEVNGVSIINTLGQIVFSDNQSFTAEKTINFTLERGIYLIRINDNTTHSIQKLSIGL